MGSPEAGLLTSNFFHRREHRVSTLVATNYHWHWCTISLDQINSTFAGMIGLR